MRESIGTTFMLNFIILFIFLVFAFLAGTLSYYKSYRVNNYIINAIEKYEGYNQYSADEIKNGLRTIGYDVSVIDASDCPSTRDSSMATYLKSIDGELESYIVTGERVYPEDNSAQDVGYCVYIYRNDGSALSAGGGIATTDSYYRYGVLTYMQMDFPVIENTLKIPIFSITDRIYYFD